MSSTFVKNFITQVFFELLKKKKCFYTANRGNYDESMKPTIGIISGIYLFFHNSRRTRMHGNMALIYYAF